MARDDWSYGEAPLPLAYWLLPVATAVTGIVVWTVWCDSPTGAWVGGAAVVATGIVVLALALEAQPHERGIGALARRTGVACLLGVLAAGAALLAAGLGLYLHCPFFG